MKAKLQWNVKQNYKINSVKTNNSIMLSRVLLLKWSHDPYHNCGPEELQQKFQFRCTWDEPILPGATQFSGPQAVAPRPAAWATPGNLLEMQILRPYSRPGTQSSILTSPADDSDTPYHWRHCTIQITEKCLLSHTLGHPALSLGSNASSTS